MHGIYYNVRSSSYIYVNSKKPLKMVRKIIDHHLETAKYIIFKLIIDNSSVVIPKNTIQISCC